MKDQRLELRNQLRRRAGGEVGVDTILDCHDAHLVQPTGLDLAVAAERKLTVKTKKYPVAKERGRATKYDKL